MAERLPSFERFLRVERRRGVLTISRYRAIVDDFIRYLAENPSTSELPATSITKQHCVGFLHLPGRTSTEEPSAAVWNQRLAALRSLFNYLQDQEPRVKDPTELISYQPTQSQEPQPLSLGEFCDLLDAAEASSAPYRARNIAILQVLYHTALRVQELVSLDLEQIEWQPEYLFRNVRTKGRKWLNAQFNDAVASALQLYIKERAARGLTTSGALFLSKRGTRLSVRGAEVLVKKLAKKAGIERDVTPHLLRHSNVDQLRRLGFRMEVPQRICNHASQRTTEKYSHVSQDEVRSAVDQLGALVTEHMRSRRANRAA